jgi:hypothetical protein
MASDVEQLAAEEAAEEGLTSASLSVGPGSEKVLHAKGITTDLTLDLDGDEER